MNYYTMSIRDRKTERVFDYVYPGDDPEIVLEVVQAFYGVGFEVGPPAVYVGSGAMPNRTPS